jgi:UDP-hydrolysing UDP-N-acetyl-D-glucosamine 2-epimerase
VENELSGKVKLAIVTGSRADYGHLKSLIQAVENDPAFELMLLVTGSHLVEQFGNTVKSIEQDGFPISSRVSLPVVDDSSVGIATALSEVVSRFARVLEPLKPTALIAYGDRWEMFGSAIAATCLRIPLVHIGGGDLTEGAYDESFRHAMTKMSHIHFVTNEESRNRVLQMGEAPEHVHQVGSLAIDTLLRTPLLTRVGLERDIGFIFQERNIIVTYHPTTLETDPIAEIQEVLAALADLPHDIGILLTQPSLDAGTLEMSRFLGEFVQTRANTKLVESLGQQRYFSALSIVDAVVGNSSSGLYEVPTFGKPTVNIGDRQGGRLRATSVIDVPVNRHEIVRAITRALASPYTPVYNPYGEGQTAERIITVLKGVRWESLLKKRFQRM